MRGGASRTQAQCSRTCPSCSCTCRGTLRRPSAPARGTSPCSPTRQALCTRGSRQLCRRSSSSPCRTRCSCTTSRRRLRFSRPAESRRARRRGTECTVRPLRASRPKDPAAPCTDVPLRTPRRRRAPCRGTPPAQSARTRVHAAWQAGPPRRTAGRPPAGGTARHRRSPPGPSQAP